MKRVMLALVACSIALAGAGAAAAASAHYEAAVVQGTPVNGAAYFRINTATGQTVVAWGNATQFNTVVDNGPVPTGDYHLYTVDSVGPDSKVSWNIYRQDNASGRAWVGLGGGTAPLVWNEMLLAK